MLAGAKKAAKAPFERSVSHTATCGAQTTPPASNTASNTRAHSLPLPLPRVCPCLPVRVCSMSRLLQRGGCFSLAQLRSALRHVPAHAQRTQQAAFSAIAAATNGAVTGRPASSFFAAATSASLVAPLTAGSLQSTAAASSSVPKCLCWPS